MPTVSAVALDSLIQGRQSRDLLLPSPAVYSAAPAESLPRPRSVDGATVNPRGSREEGGRFARNTPMAAPPPPHMSPALYATPKAFRVSADSAPSESLSPYVVDHKGRARTPAPVAPAPVAENGSRGLEDANGGGEVLDKEGVEAVQPPPRANGHNAATGLVDGAGEADGRLGAEHEATADDDEFDNDFFDSRASLRSASFSDAGSSCGGRAFRRRDPGAASFTSNSEYYDAGEDFGLDSPAPGRCSRLLEEMESELRSMRLGLFDELERRTRAEEALGKLRDRWNRMASGLSKVGLSSFPPAPDNEEENARWEEEDPAELVGRDIVATRLVSEDIARRVGVAEAEESAVAVVEAKNREIARLRERLNHYEAVNHEMSRRNLEIAEQARRRRQRNKTIKKFMWGTIGFTVVAGASLLAYTYLPQSSSSSSLPPSRDMETSSS